MERIYEWKGGEMKEIKIDIDDSHIDWKKIRTLIDFFSGNTGYDGCSLKFIDGEVWSRNPMHHHIIIRVEDIKDEYIPFMQLLFGSDYRREMLNFARLWSSIPFSEQNILFEENYKKNLKFTKKLNAIISDKREL